MKTVTIDKAALEKVVIQGNNCSGRFYLTATPAAEVKILWADNSRQWNPWGEDDQVFAIPSLFPDGDGKESEEARECIRTYSEQLNVGDPEDYMDAYDLSAPEFCENFLSDEWKVWQEEGVAWLIYEFVKALNAEPNDYHEDFYQAAWNGQDYQEGQERVFLFVI